MGNASEFRQHWRAFGACFLGIGSALSLNSYILAAFGPYLIKEFGWSKGDWARTGITVFLAMFFVPIYGRLADRFGVRRVATIGIVGFPLCCAAYTYMGSVFGTGIKDFIYIYIVQTIAGCATTQTIYSRLVAGSFDKVRGFALGLAACSPALFGGLLNWLLPAYVAEHGWRSGYILTAVASAICGLLCLALLSLKPEIPSAKPTLPKAEKAVGVYRRILKTPVFWFILLAVFLTNQHAGLLGAVLKVLVMEQGPNDASAGALVGLFSVGVLVGRLLTGAALDIFPTHLVSAFFLTVPSLGLAVLASGFDGQYALMAAMLTIGLAYGGEGDVFGYLVVRYFGMEVYSTVLGLLTSSIALASTMGHLASGWVLDRWGTFNPFLIYCAICILIGGSMFPFLARFKPFSEETA